MELIERIIRQNPWWQNKEIDGIKNFKHRELFNKISDYINNKQIISMVGLRRVGKSTLLFQVIERLLKKTEPKKILYFSFDELIGKDPEIIEKILNIYEEEILKNNLKDVFIFFDEINHIADWQVILKRFYDMGGIKFFVSGSSSIFLKRSKESLSGRIYEFELKPLSFKEYLNFKEIKNIPANRLLIKKELNNYFLKGGFPEIINEENLEKINAYLKSIIEKIIFFDIPKVYDVSEPETLRGIFEIIARNPGNLIEYKNLASYFNISYQTVSKYVSYLEKAFLIKLLYNYRGSPVARARKSKKAYIVTPNLALAFISESEFSLLTPKLVENLVVIHLDVQFFWRKYYEIDIYHENKAIEVKYRKESKIKGALEVVKKLKLKQLVVITKDLEKKKKHNNIMIEYIPLWKFLLKD